MDRHQHSLPASNEHLLDTTGLRRLPQHGDVWEVDFLPLAATPGRPARMWVGMVLRADDGLVLAEHTVETTPTVKNLAHLVADAMWRPVGDTASRPTAIHLRADPKWEPLRAELDKLGVAVRMEESLHDWDETFKVLMDRSAH